MRLYTTENTWSNVIDAADKAGVTFDRMESFTPRQDPDGPEVSGFDITLNGDSRRRPNSGTGPQKDGYAATWDQWGVFLSVLFNVDNAMKAGSPTRPYYDGSADFDYKTAQRFAEPGVFPQDAHGDHVFRFDGVSQKCLHCTARMYH